MKINKNWEPKLVTCIKCDKDFNVNYTVGENDNCLPVFNNYNLERMFRGHVDDYNWSDEEMLQWLNITAVLFICPHCHHSFGSTVNCYVCNKPTYSWMHWTGYTCSLKCHDIYLQWVDNARKRGRGGVIPREAVYGKNDVFSNNELEKNSRRHNG